MNYELLAWCCRAGTPDLLISLTFKQDFVTLQTRLLLSSNKASFKSKEALFFTRTFGNFGMTHNQLICSLLASETLDLLITDVDKQSTPNLHPIYIQSTFNLHSIYAFVKQHAIKELCGFLPAKNVE